jgi:hypothetical protein
VEHLLSDEQFLRYLVDGYVVVEPASLTDEFHQHIYSQAAERYAEAETGVSKTPHRDVLGDVLLAKMPDLQRVLDDPAVDGALHSILDPGYFVHPHHFLHESLPGDQPFHQDGNLPWNERGHYRSHRPDWALIFYYPQAVHPDNGPTELVAGTQYWTTDFERGDEWQAGDLIDRRADRAILSEDDFEGRDRALAESLNQTSISDLDRRFICVPAGSVVVAHFDIFHRGSRTTPAADPRYMFKFCVARRVEPNGPAWRHSLNAMPDSQQVPSEFVPSSTRFGDGRPGRRLRRISAPRASASSS